ncbi:hypothetical protein MKX07_005035 [Trichoderma sp. CBMAI-0711]|nr:hypothetical protein MKX07_005035 [Trichoderma sp. CBMAI-0711]
MLDTIASSLREISRLASSDPVAVSVKQNLWTSLVQSYRPRLNDYIAHAKRALKAIERSPGVQVETLTLADCTPSLPSRLEGIRALVNIVTRSPTQEGIEKLVQSAHDAYTSHKEHEFDELTGNHADLKSLRDALGYLAQNNAWTLAKTFSSLGLSLDDKTVESIVGTGKRKGSWTKNKLLQRFDKLKGAVSEVHAETQVILAATQHDCTGAAIFKYVGCSKRSCFLCSKALQNYGSYMTRGCHGKLYNLWTVPALPWLANEEGLKLVRALKNVERAMKELILNRKTDGLVLALNICQAEINTKPKSMLRCLARPNDQETLEHFGFTRCRTARERSHLIGLYQGLVSLNVGAVQLNDWREREVLVTKIIETFSRVPEQARGSYFPWFLRNQHVLDKSFPPLELDGKDHPLVQAMAAARPNLDLEDRAKDPGQLEPLSKRHCFPFYAMALDGSHPNPHWAEYDSWYDFGFATCRDEYDEGLLGGLYNSLVGGAKSSRDYDQSLGDEPGEYPDLPTCSFTEFWLAYESGSLSKLFHQYGLGYSLDRFSGLPGFLSFLPGQDALRPSIWRLKHFLALEPNTPLGNFPRVEAAAQEYGFASQLDARTRLALRQFYEQLFEKVNPLRVHEAKNRGELLEYAESEIDVIDDGVRHVLQRLG